MGIVNVASHALFCGSNHSQYKCVAARRPNSRRVTRHGRGAAAALRGSSHIPPRLADTAGAAVAANTMSFFLRSPSGRDVKWVDRPNRFT